MAPLIDLQVAELVPARYAAYRPVVSGGLRFFLERLGERRLTHILAEQLVLAPGATAAELWRPASTIL
jgi:hypothetical protein